MLDRLHIENYRDLQDVTIAPLRPLNLIAGRNNSGKTTVLEALFLLSGGGNPQLAINTNILRTATLVGPGAAVGADLPWQELFHDLDTEAAIQITGEHDSLGTLSLTIASELSPFSETSIEDAGSVATTNVAEGNTLVFRYTGPGDNTVQGHIQRSPQSFSISQPDTDVVSPAIILISKNKNLQEDAVRLGQLRRQKRGDVLLDALRLIEPNLQSVEDSSATGVPMIWGDVGLRELVPLPLMGEGMTQLTRIILAIAATPRGMVLVDEVENGFHHSILPDFWKVAAQAAEQFETQLFAVTHSRECVVAAYEALGPEGFGYHRLERADTGITCVTYEPDALDAAIRHDLEVR